MNDEDTAQPPIPGIAAWSYVCDMTYNTLTEPISAALAEAIDYPPLPVEHRFACLSGCGLCCSYRVVVTEADQRRLQATEVLAAAAEPWETAASGEPILRRALDFCLFLDPQQRCALYDQRPERCRVYPYLWITYARPELDVDFSCPGVGRGEVIPPEWRQPPPESTAGKSRREAAILEIQGLLRAQRRYAAPDMLAVLGERCLDELAACWAATPQSGALTLRVGQARPLSANMETENDLPALWKGLSLAPRSVEELLADVVFMERHFARPRWNTRLDPGEEVVLYHFWATESVLHVEERGGTHREIPLGDIGQISWQPVAIATRRAYLERWLKRQLPVRLANNMGLASLLSGGHVAICYLEFLVEIDWRLAVLAPALARASEKDTIDRVVALEAIRGSDGLLRAWCQSARLGATN